MPEGLITETGIPVRHFEVFRKVAGELTRIIIVRYTNLKSTPLIEKGYPAKPREIKIRTSAITGIVTATKSGEVDAARLAGFFVADRDGVARDKSGKALVGKFLAGEVIHPTQHKPLVGDYDLMGVLDPEALGRNIVLAASDGVHVGDRMSPDVRRVQAMVNGRLDQPRVLHGAQDQFGDFPDGGAVVFWPDGHTEFLSNKAAIAGFYARIKRGIMTDKYG